MNAQHGLARRRSSARDLFSRPEVGVTGLLVLICVVMAGVSRTFVSGNNWYNIANQAVFVLLPTLGMTIVLITGGIDLSVGSVIGVGGGVTAFLMLQGIPLPAALLVALAAGVVVGLLNGLAITKLGLPDFVATLAMLGIARGLLFLWTSGVPFVGYMDTLYYPVGGLQPIFWYITVPIITAIVIALLVAGALRWTPFGRHVFGVGSNREAARLSGVNVNRVRVSAYMLSGLLAAAAGVLLAGRLTTVEPTLGSGYELTAIAAAVIGGAALAGGRGGVIGAVIGALTLTVIQNVLNIANISATWQPIVVGLVLLLAVIMGRAEVLLRRRTTRARPATSTQG